MAATTLADIPPEAIQQSEETLKSILQAEYPSMDLSVGTVLHDILLRPAAIFHALNQTDYERLRKSQSMLEVQADPSIADDDAVERILANYRITRDPGTKASGLVTVILDSQVTVSVEQGTVFTGAGLTFVTDRTYVSVSDVDAVVSEQQRLLQRRNDGTYAFTVPVTASEVGENYRLKKNTRLSADPSISNVVDIVATQDFTGGTNRETNEELVEQFKLALAPQTMSSRVHIESLMQTFYTLNDISIIGFGDAELSRDRHNIFEMATGGKADIYVRTAPYPETRPLVKTATLISKDDQLWQLSLGKNDAPGFYSIDAVRQLDAGEETGTLGITEIVRGLDLTSDGNTIVPEIHNLKEGAYSRYQTAVVKFTDPGLDYTDLVNGAEREYRVEVTAMPGISVLADNVTSRSIHLLEADYLVRAAIPAFVTIQLVVRYTGTTPDVDAIKTAIVDRVNKLTFKNGALPVSIVHDAVYNAIGTGVTSVSPVELFCKILPPEGDPVILRSIHSLKAPNQPENGISSRTVAFLARVEDVAVTLEKDSALPV